MKEPCEIKEKISYLCGCTTKFTVMNRYILTLMGIALAGNLLAQDLRYPTAPSDGTVDNYFGLSVPDPYRPLEDENAPATRRWIDEENALTEDYLSRIPFREPIRRRLTRLNNYAKRGLPSRENDGLLYWSVNDGLRNQSVVMRRLADGTEEVFLDPNTLSDDGTVALTGLYQSPDGKLTAYTVSRSGSDWTEIFVMDTKTRKLVGDHIQWAKFTDAQWDGNDGFYYSAYRRPEGNRDFTAANEGHSVYYHRLGTPQADDRVVYTDKDHPLRFHSAYVPEGTPYIFIYGSGEGTGESIAFMDRSAKNPSWTTMAPDQLYNRAVQAVIDGKAYITTTEDAPFGRLMVADLENPAKENWKVFVPETDAVLSEVTRSGDDFLLTYERDASDHVVLYRRDGKNLGEIALPGYGAVSLSASSKYPDVYLGFTSFVSPSTIYAYDKQTKALSELFRPAIDGVNLDDYVTEQVFYPSKDGTKIPMFLTYKKGLKRDGTNPVYLYGYGGFNISLTPGFNPNRLLWLENGGIYAQANLRGGSEYGEKWHQAGTQLNKLNVFDDFIAAAEYMIKEGWTTPESLVIEGGSNGGLLVGATTNLRPDLFRVAIPRVGVMDMLRYHLFTIGWNWAPDYGTSSDSPEMAAYLRAYSPAHNIRQGVTYPAVLVTTADHDDRVVPAHSFKYAAALQAAQTGDAPKLIRIDSKAGHGAGKPVSKVIDEWTDIYSFIFKNLNQTPSTVEK